MTTDQRRRLARFSQLTAADLDCDLHMHTTRTDGQADVGSVMRAAVERGLTRIAFTEHVRRDSDWFAEFADEVRTQAAAYPVLEVLVGCEAKALDGDGLLDASDAIRGLCDLVLGSVHRFPDGRGGFVSSSTMEQDAFAQAEFELARGLVTGAPIHVLAHPGGMYARRFKRDLPEPLMRELMRLARARGVAIEISSSYLNDMPAFLALCAEIDPLVSIGSDVHRLDDLGRCRDRLRELGVGRS